MIVAAAFCPHPPALVPQVAQAAASELADLRSACRTAITRIASSGTPLAIIGAAPQGTVFDATARGTFAGFGVDLDVSLGRTGTGSPTLPLSLSVGAWLLRDTLGPGANAIGIGVHEQCLLPDGRWALLVMGDGSARRSTAAPGYLDDRAEPYDRTIADALATGDARMLTADSDGLLAAGAPVWRAIAPELHRPAAGRRWDAELLYDRAPYGVGYLVASWT